MTWRGALGLGLVILVAAGCATTPTALGGLALREGRPMDAIAEFEKALAEDPARVDARIGLGIAKFRLGLYDDAVTALTDAVGRDPKQPAARLYLALAYILKHEDVKVEEQLTALHGLPIEPRLSALVEQSIVLLRAAPLSDQGRTFVIASLDYGAEWSRDLAETRLALRHAQLAWDPFWYGYGPTYVIRCRNC